MSLLRVHALSLALAALPGVAQVSFDGNWNSPRHEDEAERGPGPELGDYLGLPINDAARLRADTWDSSRLTLPEHQCRVHISTYIYRGPLHLRIWQEKDPQTQQLIAIKHYISTYEQTRTIWMDGRPHPSPFAPHTFMGFSTGRWDGDILTVYTTHIKQGWLRRNGLAESDQATMTEHFIRHGNSFTHVSIVNDPVYMTEPLIKTEDFVLEEEERPNWLWPCQPVEEITSRGKNDVPHYLPGENPYLKEFFTKWKIPQEAAQGGPQTMYPEYQRKMQPIVPSPNESLKPLPQSNDVETIHVKGNVYMLANARGNVSVQVGKDGVLVVDSGPAGLSDKILAAIRKLSDKPLRYLINTSADTDHVSGNERLAGAGGLTGVRNIRNTPGESLTQTLQIWAHDNVLQRMLDAAGAAQPTLTWFGTNNEVFFNDEAVQMFHQPKAHTDGDAMVFFRVSDVVVTGDIFNTSSYPVIDLAKGGNVQGVIDGLNRVLDLTVPQHHEEGGTYVIPGHGRICDEFDVLEYRDMVAIIRDRVQAMIKKGMSLEQVKAAKPTRDYDPQYGSASGPWTTDMFVEAVYRSLRPGR